MHSFLNLNLKGVGHFLYVTLGDDFICEHWGEYQSSELSRFRHSRRKYRMCPMCGYKNQSLGGKGCNQCSKVLYLVEYVDVPAADDDGDDDALGVLGEEGGQEGGQEGGEGSWEGQGPPPAPAGHGALGPGGHYRGRCLCSPRGCQSTAPNGTDAGHGASTGASNRKLSCDGVPNPLFELRNRNLALVAEEHIREWQPGREFQPGEPVSIYPAAEYDPPAPPLPTPTTPLASATAVPRPPILWSGGRMGGRAVVKSWKRCGGRPGTANSWHGDKILTRVGWNTEEQDASILLLLEDGSTGLDLSFATHIFLLDRIKDPALRLQIVSRAHRMGATGPVQVQLLQTVKLEDYEAGKRASVQCRG